jgi:hypothetical protein
LPTIIAFLHHKIGSLAIDTTTESFHLHSWRNEDNLFAFDGGYQSINEIFQKLHITRNRVIEKCLKGQYAPNKDYLVAKSYDCETTDRLRVICRQWHHEEIDCGTFYDYETSTQQEETSTQEEETTTTTTTTTTTSKKGQTGSDSVGYESLDLMLNPDLKEKNTRAISLMRNDLKNIFNNVSKLTHNFN